MPAPGTATTDDGSPRPMNAGSTSADDGPVFVTYAASPDADEVRIESFMGQDHIVAPVVLVREGVLNGGLLRGEEIAASAPGWNGTPVTAPPSEEESGHPIEVDENGDAMFTSVASPDTWSEHVIGVVFNVEYESDTDALTGELWLDPERAKTVGGAAVTAVEAIVNGDPLDVSTGYWHDFERDPGTFQGQEYEEVQFDLLPDHLALLPHEEGACSWEDGCGAPRASVNALIDTMTPTTNQEDGDRVRWESDGSPRYGIIVDDQEGEEATEVLVAEYAWDGDEWVRGDDTVNLSPDTFEIIEQFPPEPASNVTLSERVNHAVHLLTGQSADCTCGEHAADDTENSTDESDPATQTMDIDYDSLAEQTVFTADELREDDDLAERVAERVDAQSDDDDPDPDPDDGVEGQSDDDGSDTDEPALDEERIESLVEERVEDALAAHQDQEQKNDLIDTITTNTEYTADDLQDKAVDSLELLAEMSEEAAADDTPAGGVNYAGRGAPRSNVGDDDEDDDALIRRVGVLSSADKNGADEEAE